MAGVVVKHVPNKMKTEVYKYSSKKFHKDAGFDVLEEKRKRLVCEVEATNEVFRSILKEIVEPKDQHIELINLKVLQFREKSDVYMTTARARLRRRKKIRTRIALDKFASKLAPNKGPTKGRTRMFYGSGFGTGFGMRG